MQAPSITTMSGKIKLKIVLLGNQSVGKSSIIQRYIHNKFDDSSTAPTVGIDFLAKNITQNAKSYRLQLWDTAGQQRFRSLIPGYLKDANIALIVFDVSNLNSLNNVQSWANLYTQNKVGGNGFMILVGNKVDLQQREVPQEKARALANQIGIPYIQVSAKTSKNVQKLFGNIITIYDKNDINAGNCWEITQKNQNVAIQQKQEDEIDQIPQTSVKKQEKVNISSRQADVQNKVVLSVGKHQQKNVVDKSTGCC